MTNTRHVNIKQRTLSGMRDIYTVSPHELLNGLRYNDIRELRLGVTDTGMHAQVNGGAWQPIGQRLPVDAATGELLTARSVM